MKWWERKKKEPPAPVVQVRQGAGHPFGLLDRYTPLQDRKSTRLNSSHNA